MSDKDFAISPIIGVPSNNLINKKPPYLIFLENDSKNKTLKQKYFISLDKPEFLNGFIQVKGIFSELSEEEISKTFNEVLTSSSKELFLEMYFPWHKICSIKSLVFKAK